MKAEIKPEDYESELVEPAVAGTFNILKAAQNTAGVKGSVITSSVAALISVDRAEDEIIDRHSRAAFIPGPYPDEFTAYKASKIAALNATEAFIKEHNPSFEVTNIHPTFMIGKHELIASVDDITPGTNALAMRPILGNKAAIPMSRITVHVGDVAYIHVKALDPTVPAGTYVANSGRDAGTVWQDATTIVEESFREEVSAGLLPNNGVQEAKTMRVDAKETEDVMRFR
jgi:nucleoside-diphosphate-sugar epimerase